MTPGILNRLRRTTKKTKAKLTPKQKAQRRYASAMRGVRARAARARGGRGRVKARKTATTLRRKLRLKG